MILNPVTLTRKINMLFIYLFIPSVYQLSALCQFLGLIQVINTGNALSFSCTQENRVYQSTVRKAQKRLTHNDRSHSLFPGVRTSAEAVYLFAYKDSLLICA